MYVKNLDKKMTLRLPITLSDYLTERANETCITPSEYIRQALFRDKLAYEKSQEILDKIPEALKGVLRDGKDQQITCNNKL